MLQKVLWNSWQMNFSGLDRENWVARSGSRYAQDAYSTTTNTELRNRERELGCCYSVLLKRPYFDTPRLLVVNCIHNLFIGTAKHFLKSMLVD